MSKDSITRLLVIPGSKAFGDALEALPTLQFIRELWPQAHLAVGYQTKSQELTLSLSPYVSERVQICPGSIRHAGIALKSFRENLRAMKGFEIILFLYKARVCWPMLVTARMTGAKVLHKHNYRYRNPRRNPYSDFPGRVFHQIVASDLLGLPLSHLREPRIGLPEEAKRFAEDFFRRRGLGHRPTVILNTLCSPVMPGWGIEKYADVANALADRGVDVLINAGKQEQIREFNSVADRLKHSVTLVETPSPLMLAAVMDKSDLVVGEASGQTWLATLLGTPAIILLGPGERNYHGQGRCGPVWWPWNSMHQFISKMEWCQMNMGKQCRCRHARRRYLALKKMMKWIGIWKPWKATLKMLGVYDPQASVEKTAPPCLTAIQVEEVVEVATQRLSTGRRTESLSTRSEQIRCEYS